MRFHFLKIKISFLVGNGEWEDIEIDNIKLEDYDSC